ncbi:MAG: transporter substrate-binding domain-containing protein [Coriobacteriales bacterium]|jgi:ABC-type amino acid transport substrate-binding protein|nr:transporter substrate-binding domain-containing protein [Coriobacteriales bacterium]
MLTIQKLIRTIFAAVLAFSLVQLASCIDSKADKLTIGTSSTRPLVNWDDGHPVGFEYELMTTIAEGIGLELDYIEQKDNFGQLSLASTMLKYDAMASELFDYYLSPDDSYGVPSVKCSIPYFVENRICLVRTDSEISNIDNLSGKVVGVWGSLGKVEGLSSLSDDTTVRYFIDVPAGVAALQVGIIDAFLIEEDYLDFFGQNELSPNLKSIGVIPSGKQYVLVFRSSNTELLEAVNTCLCKLIDDGTYVKIYSKYFNYEPTIPPH